MSMNISLVVGAILFCAAKAAFSKTIDTYRAAVVDFAVASKEINEPMETYIVKNANKMIGVIEKAKTHDADIIVFPELGTMGEDTSYFIAVPDPHDKITPADSDSSSEVLKIISKAAQTYKMYVVINVHENFTAPVRGKSQTSLYNTNVAFDRNGTIIARYRKYNLYSEDYLNRTEMPEHIYFDTDFGVRFGIFVCFDIHYQHPAIDLVREYGIEHFVYSAAWYSELPAMTAIQVQNGFSFGNGVVLLASGLNNISISHAGSGIYRGRYSKALTWQSDKDGTTLLVGDVSKKAGYPVDYSRDVIDDSDTQFKTYLPFWQENMTDYTTKLVTPGKAWSSAEFRSNGVLKDVQKSYNIKEQLCRENLCCKFEVSMRNTYVPNLQPRTLEPGLNGYLYHRMAVANGLRSYSSGGKTWQQSCLIISCLDDRNAWSCAKQISGGEALVPPSIDDPKLGKLYLNSTVFTNIKISGNFSNQNVLPTIITLVSSEGKYQAGNLFNPSNIDYNAWNKSAEQYYVFDYLDVEVKFKGENQSIVSGGIFVRPYDMDP